MPSKWFGISAQVSGRHTRQFNISRGGWPLNSARPAPALALAVVHSVCPWRETRASWLLWDRFITLHTQPGGSWLVWRILVRFKACRRFQLEPSWSQQPQVCWQQPDRPPAVPPAVQPYLVPAGAQVRPAGHRPALAVVLRRPDQPADTDRQADRHRHHLIRCRG